MAKRRAGHNGINKSDAIRDILSRNPHTPVREIVSTLNQRGITVHPNLVYLIKSKAKARNRKQKREKALENSRQLGIVNPVQLVLEVRRLAEQTGGIRHLKQLVDVLAE
jgi:hypothetical protein